MQLRKTLRFLYQATSSGLAAAFVLLLVFPEVLQRPSIAAIGERVHPSPVAVSARTPPPPRPISYANAVARAAPAVVDIHAARIAAGSREPFSMEPAEYERFYQDPYLAPSAVHEPPSLGSGVIVKKSGLVLTNHHVVEDAQVIRVLLADHREASARIVGTDPDTDLAVLKIDLPDLPTIALDTVNYPQVGDVVLAIGNPFGMGQTVTQGIISATGRRGLGINTFENFIQTDAAINPGSSGGALINPDGRLIGINSAIYSRAGGQGIGFAIPVGVARHVIEQILKHGYVARGWLGVEVQELPQDMAENLAKDSVTGVVVSRVMRHGPAHLAGLRPGDVVTHVDQYTVTDRHAVVNAIASVPPGNQVALRILRGDHAQHLQATVSQRPAEPAP